MIPSYSCWRNTKAVRSGRERLLNSNKGGKKTPFTLKSLSNEVESGANVEEKQLEGIPRRAGRGPDEQQIQAAGSSRAGNYSRRGRAVAAPPPRDNELTSLH